MAPSSNRESRPTRHWGPELIAGITVTAYLVPQVMAYATLAGIPASAALWSAIVALPVYAMLGTSRLVSAGPGSIVALLTAAVIAPLAIGDPQRAGSLAALLAVIVGIYAVVAWALRLGFLGDLLSRPVLVGYLTGVGLIMIASQLDTITGSPATNAAGSPFIADVTAASVLSSWHWPTVAIGLGVALVLIVMSPRLPRVPMPLVVVVIASVAVAMLGTDGTGIQTVGDLAFAWPQFGFAGVTLDDVRLLALPALGIFLVAFSDNLLTGRSFASGEEISGNRELLALGATNIAAAAVHGLPVSASTSRSAIARAAGGRTQRVSWVASLGTFSALVLLGGVLAMFPTAALGGLVIYAATRLLDLRGFARLWRFSKREFLVALAALIGVLVLDILYGVLAAVLLSLIQMLARVARPRAAVLGQPADVPGWHDIADYPGAARVDGLVVFRYDAPLFFANAEDFRHRALAALRESPTPPRWLLLNMESTITIDSTACDALERLREHCDRHGIVLAIVRLKLSVLAILDSHGVGLRIGHDLVFPTLPTAVDAYARWCAAQPRGSL